MKDLKRCFVLFSFYDRTGIENYLEKQAENGWLLDKISALGWQFKRIEPKKIHFSVVYFTKASAFDPEPSEAQLTFQDFCEHTGWTLAASNAQMQIFYNEAAEPTPIETDATFEVAAIHASMKKSYLSSFYLLAGCGILQALLFFWRFLSDPISILASNNNLFTGISWILMLAIPTTELIGYFSWYIRAKRAAERDGNFVETKGHPRSKCVILVLLTLLFVFFLLSFADSRMTLIAVLTIAIILALTAVICGISLWMKKRKLSTKVNRNITMVLSLVVPLVFTSALLFFIVRSVLSSHPEKVPVDTYEFKGQTFEVYGDTLPLTIEDLIETDYDEYSYEMHTQNKSIFLEEDAATQRPRWDALTQPRLNYSITRIKAPLLYNLCKKSLLDDFAHNYGRPVPEDPMWETHISIDAAPWGANEAYQLMLADEMQMRFLLCYDDCIVEIDFEQDWQLTTEQMKTIAEKLGK